MAITEKNYSEKRNFIRMKINTEITLETAEGRITGLCKDISGSGLLIEVDREFPIGTTLLAHINSHSDLHPPFRATCETTRMLVNDSGKYFIGLTVKEIHD